MDFINDEDVKLIKGYSSYYITKCGIIISTHNVRSRILRAHVGKHGYKRVALRDCGKVGYFSVHRLVATAFVENPHGKPEVNHKDGNKLNNNASNLEWCTPEENKRHGYEIGLYPRRAFFKVLSEDDVEEIIRLYIEDNVGVTFLSRKFNASKSVIKYLLRGEAYNEDGKRESVIREGSKRKLTFEQAEEIRRIYQEEGLSCNALGKRYGIDHKTVRKIINNKSYKKKV